jgi:hypothetical protein
MKKVITYILLLTAVAAFSQEKDKNLARGNSKFDNKDYVDAEASYRISASKAPAKAAGYYNLGNSIYRQKKVAEAKYAYSDALAKAKTKEEKHKIFHNVGNVLMDEKDYEGAVAAYKNALRNNPHDEQTRYNYALAKKMLKDNPPKPKPKPSGKGKEDNEAKENKNQQPENNNNPKDKEKDKNKGNEKEQDKGGGDNDQQNKQPKPQQGKGSQGNDQNTRANVNPSRGEMERMLDAMDNEEKKVQDRVNSARARSQPVKQEKDW